MFQKPYFSVCVPSPVGILQLLASDKGLCGVYFNGQKRHDDMLAKRATVDGEGHPILIKAAKQLEEYFIGKRESFDLPLDIQGSVFQMKAWKELQSIPFAVTISYGEQAARMGDPKKARAVGAANGRNPLSIIVPCHRVVGNSGSLVGFAGGLESKAFLLEHEIAVKAIGKKAA